MSVTTTIADQGQPVVYYDQGNQHFHRVTIRELVADPQFTSGYRDRLAGRPPRPFYFDEDAGERCDTWGFERGRMPATWLLATGQGLPAADDIERLALAYRAAEAADVTL